MNLHDRILSGFTGTQFWSDVGPKSKKHITNTVRRARLAFPPQGIYWFARMLNRAFTFMSIDPPLNELVQIPLKKAGPNTYVGKFPVPATPRSLWLQYQVAYILEVGPKVGEGVYQLISANRNVLPASVADFNAQEVILHLKPGAKPETLETVKSGGWKRLKWHWRRKKLEADGYDTTQAVADITFLGIKGTNSSQIFSVMEALNNAATRNAELRRAIDKLSFVDDKGKDRKVDAVYDEVNGLMSFLSSLEQLPQGEKVVGFGDGSRWVILDKAGDKVEAGLMRHCGNTGQIGTDARLMSYRIPSDKVKGFFEPKLTFIYHPNKKSFSEMKGYANSKPDAKYHDVIVALMTKPGFVESLGGNSYLPERDFSLNDLTGEQLAEIWQKNPGLIKNQLTSTYPAQRLNQQSITNLEKIVGPIRKKKKSGETEDEVAEQLLPKSEATRQVTEAEDDVEAAADSDGPVDPQQPGEDLDTFVERRAVMINRLDAITDQRQ